MSKTINYIESFGFKIVGRNILKRSESTRRLKTVGTLNDTNFYFYSDNVHPFKAGVNFYNDGSILEDNSHKEYISKIKENQRNDFNISFDEYYRATTTSSIFNNFLNKTTRDFLGKNSDNFFDLRGIDKGYMEGAVCFPFFDIDNNFLTAQIIKYGTDGKRIKSDFSTNWFHSYKKIRESLGLNKNDKYSVKVDCFFGENHLKHSDCIVAIVEAPKTAVILKELYPNIDWIATAGEQALFNKDLSVLENRNVVVFADAHTTKWKEFAGKKGFKYCDILDTEEIEEGSDIADFILDETSIVFSELHEYIFSLNAGFFNFEINKDLLEFDFKTIGKEQGYFTAVPFRVNGIDLLHQQDNSNEFEISFKGKLFNLFNKKENIQLIKTFPNKPAPDFLGYEILNANIDWHKQDRKEGGILVGMNEKSFIWHLQKCYRTLKYLNDVESLADHYVIQHANRLYFQAFEKTLDTLLINSNFRFNKAYVLNILVPLWDSYNADLNRFKKYRDWKYTGGDQLTRKEFERELNNDKFKQRLETRLEMFQDVIKENRFIHLETDLDIKDSVRGYSKIKKLVKQWNAEVIGASTLKTYFDMASFDADYNAVFEEIKKILPLYILKLIWGGRKKSILNLSVTELAFFMDYDRVKTKHIISFKPNEDTRTLIKNEIENLLDCIKYIEPLRSEIGGKTRIHNFEYFAPVNQNEEMYKHRLDPAMAFPSKEELLKHRDKIDTEYLPPSIDKEEYVKNLKTAINNEINLLESIEKKRAKTNNNKVVPLPVDVFRREETSVFEAV
jgi:hypothetical protein